MVGNTDDNMIDTHKHFSVILLELHRHGDAILDALMKCKSKKALRSEPIKSIYKTIRESCDYAPDGLLCDVKHRLEGILFFQEPTGDPGLLQSIYYGRNEWYDRYYDPPPSIIFDKEDSLTEPDVAYLCSFCRQYKDKIKYIVDCVNAMSENGPLFAFRPAHKSLNKLIHEQQNVIDKLMDMLNNHISNDQMFV